MLERGKSRTLVCRVIPAKSLYSDGSRNVSASHLALFPVLEELSDLDRLCKVLVHKDLRGFCVITLTVRKAQQGEAFRVRAGSLLAVGQRKELEEEEEEEEVSFKVKLARDITLSAKKPYNQAFVVPWETLSIPHCPAYLAFNSDSGLRLLSKGVPYFQSGKMTTVDVARAGESRRSKKEVALEKGRVVATARSMDSERSLQAFLGEGGRAELFPERVLSGRRSTFRLLCCDDLYMSAGMRATSWWTKVTPELPVDMQRKEKLMSLEVTAKQDGSGKASIRIKEKKPVR